MKIAFPVIIAKSGSDVFVDRLCKGLRQFGADATIIPLGYNVEFVPFLHRTVWKKLRPFDIVHSTGENGCLFHVPGKPLIITLHHNVLDNTYQEYTSLPQKVYHHALLKQRHKKSLSLAGAAVCGSESTRHSYAALYPEIEKKLTVIFHGVDLDVFSPGSVSTEKGLILFVGNHTRRKGADLLPLIMNRLGGSFRLICVGLRNRKRVNAGHIQVVPARSTEELAELYNRAELLLLPSRLEGFGYAIAEAMACAKPVVTTNVSSMPELVDDGKGGILCEKDDVNGFVAAIRIISGNLKLAQEMGRYNRKKAEQMFGIEQMAQKYYELYRRLLST